MMIVAGALVGLPVPIALWWSVNKSAKIKARQVDDWEPVAERLGGSLDRAEGRWSHHVLRADLEGVPVEAIISHKVVVDSAVASKLRSSNSFCTQVHAPTAEPGPSFLVCGTRSGKGDLGFGGEALRDRFRIEWGEGLESIASPAAQALMVDLWPHFRDGATLVSGGRVVSILFASSTTDPEATEKAAQLVAALAA